MSRYLMILPILFAGTLLPPRLTPPPTDPELLLLELGKMVEEIPPTLEGCQAKLRAVQGWQKSTLKKVQEEKKQAFAITKPVDGSGVPQRVVIEGVAPGADATVWVIIHPTEVSQYWVQPAATVKRDGTWKSTVHVGRPGQDSGKHFEIRAVCNPKTKLKTGKVLSGWPDGQWKSDVVEVVRE